MILRFFKLGFLKKMLLNPARRVNPGPGGWTGPGLLKDRLGQQPGQTRANPDETWFFFLNVGFETN
jgi:hypothetical protein